MAGLLVALKVLCFLLGLAAGLSIGYALFYRPFDRQAQWHLAWQRQHAGYPTREEPGQSITAQTPALPHFSVRVWLTVLFQVMRLQRTDAKEKATNE